MSSTKKVFKTCCGSDGCKSSPRFTVSSCPQGPPIVEPPPPPVFTPVYGSLYRTGQNTFAFPNAIVDFDTAGPASGVTPDTATNSITVNSTGIYTITFSTNVTAFNAAPGNYRSVLFGLRINGNNDTTKTTFFETETIDENHSTTISRTDQLLLNEGDVIQIGTIATTVGNVTYDDTALVVTKVA